MVNYGGEFVRVSADVLNILLDKVENEAYDKIKTGRRDLSVRRLVPLVHRCPRIRSRRAGRKLMHPSPSEREEDVAEHVEMWRDKKGVRGPRRGFQIGPLVQDQRVEDVDDRQSEGVR